MTPLSKKDKVMANKKEKQLSANDKLVNMTEGWIATHRTLIISLCVLVVVVVLISVVASVIINKNYDKINDSLATLETNYEEYQLLDSDSDEYTEKLTLVNEEANALLSNPGVKKYAGSKAALILAEMAYEKGDYDKAIEYYTSVYEAQKDTYLGQVALMSKASALEETGDKSGALVLYNQIFNDYGKDGIYASRALFNSARLIEESDVELAISIYEQLVGLYEESQSEYSKLATSRISQLKNK